MLIGIISFVRVDDDIFEQVLGLFGGDGLADNEEARRALEAVNADAVWLAMYERARVKLSSRPEDAGGKMFIEL